MYKIVRFPSKLEPFFDSLRSAFRWEHFEYFRTLVLLVAFAWNRRNVSNLYRHLDARGRTHRTRFNNFLLVGRWEPEAALMEKAYELIGLLSPHKGDVIDLILDDSKKGKCGKDMDAVGYIHDTDTGRAILGHQYVKATLRFRGHTIPFGIRLYVKKKHAAGLEKPFKKLTLLAAELIGAFEPPPAVSVRVLFDNYYLCPAVVKACRKKGFRFVSTIKSNRNLFRNGRKLKAGRYGRSLFRRSRKAGMSLRKERGPVHYAYVDAGWMEVSDLGRLHVVFSRKGSDKKVLGLVTDDPRMSACGMIVAYDGRWNIEVFFKDAKQLLGLGQYQNRSYRAAVTHLHLVCFAYALLTHIAVSGEGEKGKQKKSKAAHMSTGALQNELRRIVWEDLADHLRTLHSGSDVIYELERLLNAA